MFTGIIEGLAKLEKIEKEGTNIHFDFSCDFTSELKIDQSVAHNGVCLTVVAIDGSQYRVTAIDETLKRTNLGSLKIGDHANLERCVKVGDRLDGHMVQGHVDTTAICSEVKELNGSWEYRFKYEKGPGYITVPKGSICINGVSLTVVDSGEDYFSVCIIPYTFEHTNFKAIQSGDKVNLEFDILGKYISKLMANQS
jgi:riboflavin synthase